MRNPYASNKALAHATHLQALAAGENPAPVHLQLILTNRCNHNCSFCAYRMDGYTSSEDFCAGDQMDTRAAFALLSEFADMGGRAVQLTGGGEPMVHPDFIDIVAYARLLGLEVGVVTNGSLMGEAERKVLSDAAWVRVSIDAGTAETYSSVRHVKAEQFQATLENVAALSGPYKGIGFVVTKENWREVPQIVEIAESIGIDSLRLSAAFTTEGAEYFSDFGDDAAVLCAEAAKKPWVTDGFAARYSDLKQGAPDYHRCAYQHFTTYVGADMNLYRCCVFAYNPHGLVGSLKEKSLPELWGEMAEPFDAHTCIRCQFNERNRSINALIDAYPSLHADFV